MFEQALNYYFPMAKEDEMCVITFKMPNAHKVFP